MSTITLFTFVRVATHFDLLKRTGATRTALVAPVDFINLKKLFPALLLTVKIGPVQDWAGVDTSFALHEATDLILFSSLF